jgi:hypothetical protein
VPQVGTIFWKNQRDRSPFSSSADKIIRMRKLYVYRTAIGSFYITEEEGKFYPTFNGLRFGSYDSPEAVAEALARGLNLQISGVGELASLAIPSDLRDWSKLGYKLQNIRDLLSPATRANLTHRYPALPICDQGDSDPERRQFSS